MEETYTEQDLYSEAPPAAVREEGEEQPKMRLGDILVAAGVITKSQLGAALKIQREMEPRLKLGQILIEHRMTSEQRIKDTVRKYARTYRIGELLVLLDLINEKELQQALAAQKDQPRKRLGEIIVEQGFVPERQLLMALSYQFDIPYIEPDIDLLDRALLGRLSLPYLKRLGVLPVFTDGAALTVVTPDPTDKDPLKEIENFFQMPVQPAIGPKIEILQVVEDFEQLYKSRGPMAVKSDKDDSERLDENVVGVVDYLFKKAVREGASDVHIEPMASRVRVRFRIDGVLVHKTDLPHYLAPQIAARIKVMGKGDVVEKRKHQGARILFEVDGKSIDMRVSVYVTVHGENVVVRVLNASAGVIPLEQLGMNPHQMQIYKESVLEVPTGVVLFTGPTGSGKTTSLYGSIDYCNTEDVKVITAEDPVEYMIEGLVQCSIDNKAGRDFMGSLKEIVRQDPDIIVLGEVRDLETAEIAIQAALTGHKVYATFHTEDSIGALVRLLDMGIEGFLISSTVVSVVGQRLVRRVCPNCKVETPPTEYERRMLSLTREPVGDYKFYQGLGCSACHDTGYRGRIGVYEMLVLNDAVREAILSKKPANEIRTLAMQATDMVTMQEDGIAKALAGITTLDEIVKRVPRNPHQRPLIELAHMHEEQ